MPPHAWQLQEAKNKFSELVEKALNEGPQRVTRHGEEVVIVMSSAQFQKLAKPVGKLSSFFAKSPLCGSDLELSRSKDLPREMEL